MASIPSFIFGAGTKYKTQEELDRARDQVKSLLGDIGNSKFTGWGSVLADLGKGIAARVEKGRIGEGQNFLTGEQGKLWDMFGGGGGGGGDSYGGGGGEDTLTGNGSLDEYIANAGGAESGGNPNAKNPRSSASGLFQFTRGTWDNMIRTHPELGLTRDGIWDSAQQKKAMRAFTLDNAKVLDAAGIPISGGTLYGAHFLGAGGAKQAFRSPDDAPMSSVVGPGVIQANPFLSRMTVGDFKRWAAQKGGGASIDLSRSGGADALAGAGGNDVAAGGGKNDVAFGGVDPYGAIPAIDTLGQDQRAKFRDWNSNPIANEADILKGVDPALAGVIQRAKQIAGTNFVLASGQRTPEMQKKAKDFGWSKTLDSDHLGGGAGDLWPVDEKGQVVFDRARQAKIVDAMKQAAQEMGVDLEAGADWKNPDRPHFGMVGQTPMNGPIPTARPDGAGVDPIVTGSTTPDPRVSLVQARPVPVNAAGLNTPRGQEFLGRMSNPAPMGGGPQPPPMVPGMNGPMPQQGTPTPPLPMPPVSSVPGQPQAQPAPTPRPTPKVDPFTDMILGDKAAQFRPGNFSQPMAPGVAAGGLQAARQALRGPNAGVDPIITGSTGGGAFPPAPPAPGTPAAAGFGVPRAGGGGGAFPPAPPAPAQQQAGGGDKISKLMFVLSSPYASDEQKRMAAAMLDREYALEDERRKAASPEAMLDMQYKQALIDKARAEAGGSGGPDFDDTSGVRKEITALPSYKNLAQAAPIWSSVVSAADRKTTQADLNIILGIAKIMDPTSVVRTEEGESVRDTGGASTELSKWFSYLQSNSNAVLDDSIREKLLNEGYSRVKGYEDEYARDTEFYGQFADRNKIDRANIIRAFPPARQWKPGGDNTPIDPNDPLGIRKRK